jgi:hypothetical protein
MTVIKAKGMPSTNDDAKTAGVLSKSALTKLNAQAPELSKFVVAFKDLSQELPEETGMQVGMLILDIKGIYYYIPVLAKAGQVQVLESMFDSVNKQFIPITRKYIDWVIRTGHKLGSPVKIPSTVAKDPSLYDAIVPPKTGKYAYASEGRLGGFFATLPNHIKQATLEVITSDFDFRQALAPLMDIDIAKEFLKPTDEGEVSESSPAAPVVITSAEGLTSEQIQEIMAKGYIVKNPPKSKRVAVEASSNQALTRIGVMNPYTAVSALTKSGKWTSVACLRTSVNTLNIGPESSASLYVTEDGYLLSDPTIVVDNGEMSYDAVIERLSHKKLEDINLGEYGLIFTGSSWVGPIRAEDVSRDNGWINVSGNGLDIMMHPEVRTIMEKKGNSLILSTSAVFYPVKDEHLDMEKDLGVAEYKRDLCLSSALNTQSTLINRNGVYAVDGREIGDKPKVVEHLLNHWQIDVPSVETFIKKAEENGKVIVKMAAVRDGARNPSSGGVRVQPFYEHGNKPGSDDDQITGSAMQRARGMASVGKSVAAVKDREIMEATLIAEMLQNPDLEGSIKEYLPEIKNSVDKLGRTLFLMRINTNKLNDSIDSEALNNLFTSTRNAYRILGESCVALENLVAHELD